MTQRFSNRGKQWVNTIMQIKITAQKNNTCFGSTYSKSEIFNTLELLMMVGGKKQEYREQKQLVRDPSRLTMVT